MRRLLRILLATLLAATLAAACTPKKSTSSATASAVASASPTSSNGVALDANGCPTSNTVSLAKTKFVLHAGLAFGTFHRYIYKPYEAGTFKKGTNGRITALVKGAATALFDAREVRLAITDVKANPTLCRAIIVPLQKLASAFDTIKAKIKGGDTSEVDSSNTMIASIASASSADGTMITESTDESAS